MSYFSTKAYNTFSDSLRTEEVDPLDQKYLTETLLEATNISTNTTSYVYINMNGYRHLGVTGVVSSVATTDVLTVTVEADCEDNVDPTGPTYVDVTNAWFGVASWVDTDFCVTSDPIAVTWVRIKYVTSNDSGNDCDLNLYIKKMF